MTIRFALINIVESEFSEADRTTTYSPRLTTYLKMVEIPEALLYNSKHPGERGEGRAG